jgi:hypothetical protein
MVGLMVGTTVAVLGQPIVKITCSFCPVSVTSAVITEYV